MIAGTMFFVAGAAIRHILTLGVLGGGVLFGIVAIAGYGLNRFTQFVSAESDPEAGGFQVLQLLIALGSGGITGVGLGESRQKFFYVPSAHTDGVFAIIGEEIGFIGHDPGAAAAFALPGLPRHPHRAARARQVRHVAGDGGRGLDHPAGVFQHGRHHAHDPLTGIPLPFISFGSSALVSTLAGAGLLVSVSRFTVGRIDDEGVVARRLTDFVPRPSRRDSGGES